jgi:hypothetical protein
MDLTGDLSLGAEQLERKSGSNDEPTTSTYAASDFATPEGGADDDVTSVAAVRLRIMRQTEWQILQAVTFGPPESNFAWAID